ncbi:zinc finger CCCH domain-containing protein 8 isoform X1 [Cebus imitator]|uniref:zinc finger CCCH domain-containing protein 8 isoform X1 n=1 Tax=Cebus imitator TaxID=2715852 RepID=UPI000809CE9F|nr:zinc finger CCCH domain-containing protein 8 isoform X1 [Cebus imitator]
MDFENLFSKPPNPALGKTATDSDERIVDEVDVAGVEETQEEKSKQECEQISKKFRHFGNSTISPKSSLHRKSRSKDYDVYSDKDICNQEPEDNFAKELQQYIQAREMANAAQPEESMKKEGVKNAPQAAKQKNKNLKAGHKNGKQKKMKRKWPGTGNKGSNSQEEDGKPKEKQQHLSQAFINQHTVERKGKQICKYFLERKCIKGDQCKFDHDAEIEKKKEMCKFYVQGYCTRGENCLYLHNILYHKI